MDNLKSGYPFWAIKNGLMHRASRLTRNHATEVLVVGAGITGALICERLQRDGRAVTVVDERDVSWGSTSASTALLQYEIDTSLVELTELYGEENASMAYKACADAVERVEGIVDGVGGDVDFAKQRSLYFASKRSDVKSLEQECELRAKHGFDVHLLHRHALDSNFGLKAPLAIMSRLAARVDPYRLASKLFTKCVERGAHVFDRTRIEDLVPNAGGVQAQLQGGARIDARYVVIAAGYSSQDWLKESFASNRSSYAFITDPLPDEELGALRDTMVWETARPYFYLRATGDGRLIVGGEDDGIDFPLKRDASVAAKAEVLVKRVERVFPRLKLEPTFSWAGTFAETEDGLPYFGSHPQFGPRVQFAMAYGGNGITYSMIGADIIAAQLNAEAHPLACLFSFQRSELERSQSLASKAKNMLDKLTFGSVGA